MSIQCRSLGATLLHTQPPSLSLSLSLIFFPCFSRLFLSWALRIHSGMIETHFPASQHAMIWCRLILLRFTIDVDQQHARLLCLFIRPTGTDYPCQFSWQKVREGLTWASNGRAHSFASNNLCIPWPSSILYFKCVNVRFFSITVAKGPRDRAGACGTGPQTDARIDGDIKNHMQILCW